MYHNKSLSSIPWILDTVCLIAFVSELCLRVGAYSWWIGPDAVLRNTWSLLDVYLVVLHGITTSAAVRGAYEQELSNCLLLNKIKYIGIAVSGDHVEMYSTITPPQ